MSSEAKMVSERDAVMRERAAFVAGACDTTFATRDGARDDAGRRYKLPKVERPRVVPDPQDTANRVKWRYVAGRIQWQEDGGEWCAKAAFAITPERVKLWASLLASPVELVDEPSVSSGTE